MAVQDGFGKVSGSESLVFAYDLKDTINSYSGEPTTNICNNADFSTAISGTAGGTFGGWTFGSWDTSNSHETVTDTYNGQSINALKITLGNYPAHFFSSNWGTETIPGRTYTWTNLLKGTPGQVVQMYSHWGNLLTVTLTGEWQEFSTTFVRGATLGLYMYYNPIHSAVGNVIYVARVQVEEKSHKTPFTTTSRSNTQGLLDLTGNNTINLSNVSFDSNAKMVFDGTNDYVDVPHNDDHSFSGDFTIESIIYPTSNTANCIIQKGSGNDYFQEYWLLQDMRGSNSYISLIMGKNGNSDANYIQTANISVLNTYHHIIATVNGNTATIYVNGEQKTTGTISNRTQSSDDIRIGWRVDGFAATSGKIPLVKLYNRSLSPSEITNNYLKYKRQYGLT
jgi:hypothetical protein